ncbi:rhamnulokinase [Naasia lichenicola]|uniref:Rhamnulokinase n=1 Tax=Naasia lichenicola TaxID=2565933 RepID=A0A4V3WST3_9MICO|nr:rhamnulokinase family protein [Naasia lichenicola]THG29327.1 rhamnulokinase [Naasia lichenicola]
MTALTIAAVDLGAESGRLIAARYDGNRIDLDVVRRFANTPITVDEIPRWDIEGLWGQIASGLVTLGGTDVIASVGVDSWGVDLGLFRDGELLELPVTYRDPRRRRGFERAMSAVGAERIFAATGSQLHEINGVYGLVEDQQSRPQLIAAAEQLLMIPDIFHQRLSGVFASEYSVASTSGMYDVGAGRWADGLMTELGLPTSLLPEIIAPGTTLGRIRLADAAPGLAQTLVIAPAAHDTASAVVAMPGLGANTLFISSGTWSLAGVLLDHPVVSDAVRERNLTNEGGYAGTVRLLRDIVGLWILQECRRDWEKQGIRLSYEELGTMIESEAPLRAWIDVDSGEFLHAGGMPDRIRAACERQGMPVPETPAQVARVVVDSLALAYKVVVDDLEAVTGQRISGVSVAGGGTANRALQRATASATGVPVTTWSREATALGNAAVQLQALGEITSPEDFASVIAASSTPETFEPGGHSDWRAAVEALADLRLERSGH